MKYPIYKYMKSNVATRPTRRFTAMIVLHRITVGKGVTGIVDFFTTDPEGVATVVVGGLEKRLDSIRDWRAGGVPSWASEKAFVPYHFLVDRDGKINRMLEEDARGAHCAGVNNHSIGIGVVGDFRKREATGAQILSLKKLCRNLLRKYRRQLEKSEPIRTHDEVRRKLQGKKPKGCPGNLLNVDEVRSWAYRAVEIMDLDDVERY